jgi:cytochrome o ubiquinol oxidase subunit II
VIPAATPISFDLTSSGVMNSFFVPQLGSQIYTMARMVTHLQLMADTPGTYSGFSAQFSGAGFAEMQFAVEAVPPAQFAQWVRATRGTGPTLDTQSYADLTRPTRAVSPFTYGAVAPDLFQSIVDPEAMPMHASHSADAAADRSRIAR